MMIDSKESSDTSHRRIGVFGGSFDPPHLGHFICAQVVGEKLGLEKILVIPTAIQPHKPAGSVAKAEERWAMVKAITTHDEMFTPSRIEIDRSGISYSVDTLETLVEEYPLANWEIFLIVGSDAYSDISSWRNPDRIFELANLAVMCRAGHSLPVIPYSWRDKTIEVETPFVDFSSTWIKKRIRLNLPIRWLVGEAVDEIIQQQSLYR